MSLKAKRHSSMLHEGQLFIYSRLSLSRLRLSQLTAYLEEKIWSFVQRRNLTSDNKILWIRREIALLRSNFSEQFLPFSTIFSVYIFKESNYIFICEIWLFYLYFPPFCKSDMSKYGFLKVFQRVRSTSR